MLIYGTVRIPGKSHHRAMHDGAFIVIDTTLRTAAYCYPSSELAELAKTREETAATALFRNSQLHATHFAHCAELLQFCLVSGHSSHCGYCDAESIVADMPRADLEALAAHCTFRSAWTNAVELATGTLPQVWTSDVA